MGGKVVAIEGLIGAGKTSFSTELQKAMGGGTLLFQEPDEGNKGNPYLSRYYGDPNRWAFTMQIHLLQTRHRIHLDAQWYTLNRRGDAIIDRPIFGDTAFARLQLRRGNLSPEEYETYRDLYQSMMANVLHPQFLIQLMTTPETSARRIAKRMSDREGRRCESVIELDYLQQLSEEINHVTRILEGAGVNVLRVDWDADKSEEDRRSEIQDIAEWIRKTTPEDLFLDLHRRTM